MIVEGDRYLARLLRLALACTVALAALLSAPITAGAAPAAVEIERSRLIINDEAIFPLAIYAANNPDRMLSEPEVMKTILRDLADSPFHILINYAGPSGSVEAQRSYLDALQDHGLFEIFSLKDFYTRGVWGESPYLKGRSEQEAISEVVNRLKDHPAILGWYISDEEIDTEAVQRFHQYVTGADPSRFTLTLVNQPDPRKIAGFYDAGDILSIDSYPIGNSGQITDVARYTDALVAATQKQKPSWFVVQAYGGYMNRSDFRDRPGATVPLDEMRTRGRAPTPREMRTMTFLALTHGATGIVFYYYKDIQMAFDRSIRWAAAKEIGEEIRRLSPILLTGDLAPGHIISDNEQVHWSAKPTDKGLALIAVNAATTTQSATFTLPAPLAHASIHSGVGFAHAQDNQVLLILDGYEAVVVDVVPLNPFDWSSAPVVSAGESPDPGPPAGGGHWRFEEEDGIRVRDTFGETDEAGVLTGQVTRVKSTLPAGALPGALSSERALEFSGGKDSSLIMNAIDALDVGTHDFTLEGWVYPRDTTGASMIAGKRISGWFEDRGYDLLVVPTHRETESEYYIQFDATSLDRSLRSPPLTFNVWRHVAVVREGRAVQLYVDARAVDEAALSPPGDLRSRQRFSIGCSALEGEGGPSRQFNGFIDEIRLVIGEALPPSSFLYGSPAEVPR